MSSPTITNLETSDYRELVASFRDAQSRIREQVGRIIVGQDDVIEHLLVTLLVGGHCLITGMPGTAKTLLVRALATSLGLKFKRIQFTPDLMPTDVTGTDIIEEDVTTGRRKWTFVEGPIFTNVLLADEVNRTPPKTQAALLEAMQELSVTVRGVTYQLEPPFFVLATQNPIELEGTYTLPEAQLDRFLFKVILDYLDNRSRNRRRQPQYNPATAGRGRLHLGRRDPTLSAACPAGPGFRQCDSLCGRAGARDAPERSRGPRDR